MIGRIESYDSERQIGEIKSEGKNYEFHIDEWNPENKPEIGKKVDFLPEEDGTATSIDIASSHIHNLKPVKNHYIAGILGIFFGFIGLHRIYLGFYPIAIAQIFISFVLGFQYGFMWGIIEGVLIISKLINKDVKGRPLK